MAKKRNARKRKRRIARLGLLVLLAAVAVLAVVLVIRSFSDQTEDVPQEGDALWDGGWYDDDLGVIRQDRPLVRGMKAFEKKTGSKPYLTLLQGIEPETLDTFAQDQYEALFTEGDHLLVVYDEWGEDVYYLSARMGVGSALTEADVSALLAAIEKAYADPANASYAAAFGAGFRQGAKAVSVGEQTGGVGLLIALGVLLVALSVILILFLRKKARDAVSWEDEDS